jgi:putative Mg2+ transporter-C (MgtC) family protein
VALWLAIINPFWTDPVPLLHQSTFPRLLEALVLGICIGAERQWRQRAAGLRTNTLVCLGAAAFVDLGLTVAPNTTQVIAYVVSGVGFLGAGAIMKDGANVRGLNTAATLWCSAAVGACAGAGETLDAVFVAVLLFGINSGLRPLSRLIDRRSLSKIDLHVLYRLRVLCETQNKVGAELAVRRAIDERLLVLRELKTEDNEETETSLIQAVVESHAISNDMLQDVAEELRASASIESVEVASVEDPEAE